MRISINLRKSAMKAIDHYGRYHPSVLSIQQFLDFGMKQNSEKSSFIFLKKEIPVRLANMMKEIQLLPPKLLDMPSVKIVKHWYEQSFDEILEYEEADPNNAKILKRFHASLDVIRKRHVTVVETMAEGVMEMKDVLHFKENKLTDDKIHYFLDRFYLSRISIRLIIHQHLLLFSKLKSDKQSLIGCFDPNCDVMAVAKDAFNNAKILCESYYNQSPSCVFKFSFNYNTEIDSDSGSNKEGGAKNITMPYVPVHLYYILFELFKNSMRSVIEFNKVDNNKKSKNIPPLELLISKGREDVIIKLSDLGGGVLRRDIDTIFNYLYSTAPLSSSSSSPAPLAGYGYGLPLSRLYAKYFNGDLLLNSIDGFGTDALVYLKVLPKEASELLPVYNKTSSLKYTSQHRMKDWSEPFIQN